MRGSANVAERVRASFVGLAALAAFGTQGCATAEESESAAVTVPVPEVAPPEPPPYPAEARERAVKMFGSAGPARTPGPGCELEASAPRLSLDWLDAAGPGTASRSAASAAPLRLSVVNRQAVPSAVRVTLLLTAGRRAREWRSEPFDLASGETHVVTVDLARLGVRATAGGAPVEVQATADLFFGDDRMEAVHDPGRLRGAVEHAVRLHLAGAPGGAVVPTTRVEVEEASVGAAAAALIEQAGLSETGGLAGVVSVDESQESAEAALEE